MWVFETFPATFGDSRICEGQRSNLRVLPRMDAVAEVCETEYGRH